MSTKYSYSISLDTASGSVNLRGLLNEIAWGGITGSAVDYVDGHGDVCDIWFFDSLSNEEFNLLTDIVNNHEGLSVPNYKFHASSKLVENKIDIVSNDWQDLGGIVTNIGFFTDKIEKCFGNVVFDVKCDGDVELRMIKGDGTLMTLPSIQIADTLDLWEHSDFVTNQLADSFRQTYILQGKLITASSASVRFASISLLESV